MMPWWPKKDKLGIPGDIPKTRETLLKVATKFNIYFLMVMAFTGGVLFIVGLVGLRQHEALLETVPEPIMLIIVGMIVFSLFFPWFTVLYFGRHFLLSVTRIEKEIEELKRAVGASSADMASDSDGNERTRSH